MASHSFVILVLLMLRKTLVNVLPCFRPKGQKPVEMLASSAVVEADPGIFQQMRGLPVQNNSDLSAASLATAVIGPHNRTFPAVIDLVLQQAFPYPLMGSLHMSSVISVPSMSRLLKATGLASAAEPVASGSGSPVTLATEIVAATWNKQEDKPHKRGVESTFNVRLLAGETSLWESKTKILFFKKTRSAELAGLPAPAPMPGAPTLPFVAPLRLPASLPKEWTRLTGDANPIHVHWLFAWALGFRSGRRVVGHGMSVLFLALPTVVKTLQSHAADGAARPGQQQDCYQLEVSFLRPTFVPSIVSVHVGNAVSGVGGRSTVPFEIVSGSSAEAPAAGKITIQGQLSISA